MSFYVFTTPDGMHYRHDENPYSVTILDSTMKPLSATFQSADNDFDCATSLRSNRFAMGYWNSSNLSVFDLTSGDLQSTFPFRRIGPLATFDELGTRLLFKSGSQVVLLNVQTSEPFHLKGVRALDRMIVLSNGNEVIVPSQKKDELLRISLRTGDVSAVSLPLNATLFDLKRSPRYPHLIAIDRTKSVHCIDCADWSIVWSDSFKKILGKDHMGVGQFSGDGTLFGAAISGKTHNYTLVIDAHTGKLLNRLPSICYGLPCHGTLVRNNSTRTDKMVVDTLDLANGNKGLIVLSENDGLLRR